MSDKTKFYSVRTGESVLVAHVAHRGELAVVRQGDFKISPRGSLAITPTGVQYIYLYILYIHIDFHRTFFFWITF